MPDPVTRSRWRPTWASKDKFDRAIVDFSERYADQNEQDYEAFTEAIRVRSARSARGRVMVPNIDDARASMSIPGKTLRVCGLDFNVLVEGDGSRRAAGARVPGVELFVRVMFTSSGRCFAGAASVPSDCGTTRAQPICDESS